MDDVTRLEVARLNGEYKRVVQQDKDLRAAWTKLAEGEQATQKSLGDLRAKRASEFTKNAAGYLKSRDAGITAQRARGAVELAKLRFLGPVDFARAATMPDLNLLNNVNLAVQQAGYAEKNARDTTVNKLAWATFLKSAQATGANMTGSYAEMEERYGPRPAFGPGDGELADRAADLDERLVREKNNYAEMNAALEKIGPDSWETYLRNNPTRLPEDDATYEAFVKDAGIDLSIMPGANSPFIKNIEDVARNPGAHPAFFSDIDPAIEASNKEQKRYEDKLDAMGVLDIEETPGESKDPTMREVLAGWVRRPEVQWWAKKNGFDLGTAEPVDPESPLGKDVAAGRYPDKLLVNGMLYTSRPDDIRALRLAAAQMEGDPEDNIFRAIGLARKTGPRRMVEVTPVNGETFLAEYREPVYGRDYPDSVRFVDPASGEETVLTKEQQAKPAFFPAGEPSKAQSLAATLNGMSAKKTAKKEGHDLSDEAMNEDVPGPKPTAAQVQKRRTATEAMRAALPVLPDKTLYENLAPKPDKETPPPLTGLDRALASGPTTGASGDTPSPEDLKRLRALKPPPKVDPVEARAQQVRERAVMPGSGPQEQLLTVGGEPRNGRLPSPQPQKPEVIRGGVGGMDIEGGGDATTPQSTVPTASSAMRTGLSAMLKNRKKHQEDEAGGAAP